MKVTALVPAILFGLSLAAGTVAAQYGDDLLAEQSWEGVPWRSGGVGSDERARLEALSREYNLKLTFAEKGTLAFVADVTVRVFDEAGGTVLEAAARGPWLLTRLPPGKYRVTATQSGHSQEQNVTLAESGLRELHFYW